MTDNSISPSRFPTWAIVVVVIVVATINAVLSVMGVALAVPGSGSPGPGFTTIGLTFLAGNIALFGYAIFSARRALRRQQVIGVVWQLLTVPLCVGASTLIMWALGITSL